MYLRNLSFLPIILLSLHSTGCNAKSDNNNEIAVKTEYKPQPKEVNLKKTSEKNQNNTYILVKTKKEIIGSDHNDSTVTISHHNILFSIKTNNENSLLSYSNNSKKLVANIPVDFNYIYGDDLDDATKKIKIFINSFGNGILILPTAYEELPTFILIPFDKNKLGKSTEIEIVSNDCKDFDKIRFDKKQGYLISQGSKQCNSRIPVYKINSQESKPEKAIPKKHNIQKSLEGKFLYSTYQQVPGEDTSFGKDYTLTISKDGCKLDIVGYQADTHVECELKDMQDIKIIEVYDKTNGSKFGEIKQKKNGDLFLNITYFDAFNEKSDNTFYPLKRLK